MEETSHGGASEAAQAPETVVPESLLPQGNRGTVTSFRKSDAEYDEFCTASIILAEGMTECLLMTEE